MYHQAEINSESFLEQRNKFNNRQKFGTHHVNFHTV